MNFRSLETEKSEKSKGSSALRIKFFRKSRWNSIEASSAWRLAENRDFVLSFFLFPFLLVIPKGKYSLEVCYFRWFIVVKKTGKTVNVLHYRKRIPVDFGTPCMPFLYRRTRVPKHIRVEWAGKKIAGSRIDGVSRSSKWRWSMEE